MNSYILQMLSMMNPAERDFMGLSQLAQEALKNRNPQKVLTNEEIAEKLKGVEQFKESVNYPERKSTGELGTASPYSQVLNPLQTNVRPSQNIWDPAAQGVGGYPDSPQGNMGTTGQQQTWNNPIRPFVGGNRIPQEVSDALIPPVSEYFDNWKNPAPTTRFPVEGAHPATIAAYKEDYKQDESLDTTSLKPGFRQFEEDGGMEVGGTVETNRNFAEAMPFGPSSQMAQSGFPDLSLGNLADEKVVEGQLPSTTKAVGPQEQSIWQKLNPYANAMLRAAAALGTPGNYGAFTPAFAKGLDAFATGMQETALMDERRARTDLQRRNVAAQEGQLELEREKEQTKRDLRLKEQIDVAQRPSANPNKRPSRYQENSDIRSLWEKQGVSEQIDDAYNEMQNAIADAEYFETNGYTKRADDARQRAAYHRGRLNDLGGVFKMDQDGLITNSMTNQVFKLVDGQYIELKNSQEIRDEREQLKKAAASNTRAEIKQQADLFGTNLRARKQYLDEMEPYIKMSDMINKIKVTIAQARAGNNKAFKAYTNEFQSIVEQYQRSNTASHQEVMRMEGTGNLIGRVTGSIKMFIAGKQTEKQIQDLEDLLTMYEVLNAQTIKEKNNVWSEMIDYSYKDDPEEEREARKKWLIDRDRESLPSVPKEIMNLPLDEFIDFLIKSD